MFPLKVLNIASFMSMILLYVPSFKPLPATAQELKMSQLGLEIDVTDERGNGGNDGQPSHMVNPEGKWPCLNVER